jgi:hypothetical protein
MALGAASLGAGTASAAVATATATAARPGAGTLAQWQAAMARIREPGTGCYNASYPALSWRAARCVTAPKFPLAPVPSVKIGDGHDYSAQVPGLISLATGTFQDVSAGITERGTEGGGGSKVANAFTLQLNSEFFTGSPACSGSSDPASCQAWQQFVYAYQGTGSLFMQYWLINYDATCPSGWFTYSADCYTNSASTDVSKLTAKQLATVQLSGLAQAGGNDGVLLAVGTGKASLVTGPDSEIDLASNWNTAEWGVYGDGGGSEAYFNTGASLEARTTLTATSTSAPTCVLEGFTGETSNLKLAKTPAITGATSPTIASTQTNGTTGAKSCAVAG